MAGVESANFQLRRSYRFELDPDSEFFAIIILRERGLEWDQVCIWIVDCGIEALESLDLSLDERFALAKSALQFALRNGLLGDP